ncbi:MAG: hypothetical protein ABJE95_24010 [Byssovorax sp.]
MPTRWTSTGAVLALLLASPGCATSAMPRPNAPIDTLVVRRFEAMPSERAVGRVQQTGSTVTLSATRVCDLHQVRSVDRAELHHVANDAPRQPAIWALTFGALAGTGGIVITSVALATSEGRLAPDLAAGGIMSAVGAGLVGLGIAILPSAARPEVRRARIDLDDGVQHENAPCPAVIPAARAPVTGKIVGPPALEIPFGDTDAAGAMVIELSDALPPPLYRDAPAGTKLTLYVGDSAVGTASLDEVAIAVEERAWPIGAAEACATTSSDETCARIERHLHDFPSGHHADEARAALARATAGLPARRRAEAAEKAAEATEAARQKAIGVKEQAAAEAAKRGAAAACKQICATSCKGSSSCLATCVAGSCP